jgi:Rrf2 family protein
MTLSTKAQYALEALVELQLHTSDGQGSLPAIAERRGLSEPYLEQIFSALRRAGIVKSSRGAQGGFRLAADPSLIRVGDIISALEGPLYAVKCVDSSMACPMQQRCPTRPLWVRVSQAIRDTADQVTLQQLVDAARGNLSEPEYQI